MIACVLSSLAMVGAAVTVGESAAGRSVVSEDVASVDLPAHGGMRVLLPGAPTLRGPAHVAPGQRITLRGRARVLGGRAARARTVQLWERRASWKRVASKRTTRAGRFTFRLTAGQSAGRRMFKVVAPRVGRLPRRASSPVVVNVARVSATPVPQTPTQRPTQPPVTPRPTGSPTTPVSTPEPPPLGVASDWTYLTTSGSVRWNPCAVIDWAYNPSGAPYGSALADVTETFTRIANRTGLRFNYVGTTGNVQSQGAPAGVEILVSWSDATLTPSLAGTVVGIGGGKAQSTSATANTTWRLTSGYLVLDREAVLRPGFDVSGSPTWGQVMQHETLHATGLGHASGPEQVMYPAALSGNHRFGAGDLQGMTMVGSTRGCLS